MADVIAAVVGYGLFGVDAIKFIGNLVNLAFDVDKATLSKTSRNDVLCDKGTELANLMIDFAGLAIGSGLTQSFAKVTGAFDKIKRWLNNDVYKGAGKIAGRVKNKASDWRKAFHYKIRRQKMEKWTDPGTGNPFRQHELDAAIEFEKRTGKTLKATTTGKGDFQDVVTGKVYDHFGMGNAFNKIPRPLAIEQFKTSVTNHRNKLRSGEVDELILDFKDFTPSEIADIKRFIRDNYTPLEKGKVFFLNE